MASHLITALIPMSIILQISASSVPPPPTLRLPHTFTYEAQTPQKITTGCRGTLFPDSKETHQIFYIIDSTGTMKYVEPGSSVQVIFPFSTDGLRTYPHKRQKVRFTEICFPSQCNAPSCGNIVGPLTYGSPVTSQISQSSNWFVAGNPVTDSLQGGVLSGAMTQSLPSPTQAINGKVPVPTTSFEATQVNTGTGSVSSIVQTFTSQETPLEHPGNAAQPHFVHTSSSSSMVTSSVPASEGVVVAPEPKPQQVVLEQPESAAFSTSASSSTGTITGSNPIGPEIASTLSVQPLIVTRPEVVFVDAQPGPNPEAVVEPQVLLEPALVPSPQPLDAQLESELTPEAIPPPSLSTIISSYVHTNGPEVTVTPTQGSPISTNTLSSTFTGNNGGVNCPASCPCCQGPSQFSTNTITATSPVMPSWPTWFPLPWTLNLGMAGTKANVQKSPGIRDASYYANLPGAIRGSTHVIYYPSCARDAYYQPAIVNFCSFNPMLPNTPFPYGKVSERVVKS